MALSDVQRNMETGEIVSVHPANYWRDLRKKLEAKTVIVAWLWLVRDLDDDTRER